MKKTASFVTAMLAATSALAAWEKVDGGVTAKPSETNSTIEALHVHCLEGPAIDLYSRDLGPVRPLDDGAEADYFYKPGMISAEQCVTDALHAYDRGKRSTITGFRDTADVPQSACPNLRNIKGSSASSGMPAQADMRIPPLSGVTS